MFLLKIWLDKMLELQATEDNEFDACFKHVFLMRHFSTHCSQFGIHDRDRTLVYDKSKKELDFLKAHCSTFLEKISLVFCSNTKRTLQTLEAIKPYLSPRLQVYVQDSLYCASLDSILDIIRTSDLLHKNILVIGHNPSVGCFLQEVQKENLNAHFSFTKSFPIGGVAVFENIASSWIETNFSSLKLTDLYHFSLKS
ncbi:MAG: hypothetical protein HEEMFOPI_00483 [Holosporales bacterium]